MEEKEEGAGRRREGVRSLNYTPENTPMQPNNGVLLKVAAGHRCRWAFAEGQVDAGLTARPSGERRDMYFSACGGPINRKT